MPTLFTHPAVPLAARLALGARLLPGRLLVAAVVFSLLPDLDVLAFSFGLPYGHVFGHRGFFHSLTFAAMAALVVAWVGRGFGAGRRTAFAVLFATMASHGLLDAMTDGGKGIALLSPFTNTRYFLPWRFIPVSPLGVARFFNERGLRVLTGEFGRLWVPLMAVAAALGIGRWIGERGGRRGGR
ncbi:MAG: metal-dependent hydrolase [Elusimicrobia bacterium]|nr:metal-dependent hydrolase [Elusimicrobiota bacterium]